MYDPPTANGQADHMGTFAASHLELGRISQCAWHNLKRSRPLLSRMALPSLTPPRRLGVKCIITDKQHYYDQKGKAMINRRTSACILFTSCLLPMICLGQATHVSSSAKLKMKSHSIKGSTKSNHLKAALRPRPGSLANIRGMSPVLISRPLGDSCNSSRAGDAAVLQGILAEAKQYYQDALHLVPDRSAGPVWPGEMCGGKRGPFNSREILSPGSLLARSITLRHCLRRWLSGQ